MNGNAIMIVVCVVIETEMHVVLKCKCYGQMRRRWMSAWHGLYEKERSLDVIKELNEDVNRYIFRNLREVWTKK